MDCLFCKMVSGEINPDKVFENDHVLGFKDLYPQAKEHYLFISKKHTANINEIAGNDPSQLDQIFTAIKEFTESNALSNKGFRIVNNLGADAGQTVFHTHFHVLGGEKLRGFGS